MNPTNQAALRRARFLRANRATRPCRYCDRHIATKGGLAKHEKVCVKNHASQATPQPDCLLCGGTGFVSVTRRVPVAGFEPYDAEFAQPCQCRGRK